MEKNARHYGAAALAVLASSAWGQSSVSIYGVLDAAVEHVSNVGASGSGLTRMPDITGSVPSRLGFRGREDLGGEQRALFVLEMGIAPGTGGLNQGGRAFGRQAVVGFGGPWGQLTLGRQNTMLGTAIGDSDILGPNIYGTGSLDPYLPAARVDHSVGYRGTFSGVTVGGVYSLGRDGLSCAGQSATDKRACRGLSAALKYDAAAWGVALGVDELRGGAGGTGGLTNSALKDTRTMANGYVKFGSLKVGGGLIRRTNDASATTPRSDMWYLAAAYPVTPLLTVDGGIYRIGYKNSPNSARMVALRAVYSLSRRTAVYATAARLDNNGTLALSVSAGQGGSNPAPGGAQTGLAMGIRHSF